MGETEGKKKRVLCKSQRGIGRGRNGGEEEEGSVQESKRDRTVRGREIKRG